MSAPERPEAAIDEPPYMAQIDGLRAVAVAMVLVYHYFGLHMQLGSWGVTLFFVISGFLITGVIDRLRRQGLGVAAAARRFFVRRTFRLFPAYYLVIIIGAMLYGEVRQDFAWYAGYATNILIGLRQAWIKLTPTWSLAVEEQFYLLWFFVALLSSRFVLVAIIVALAVFSQWARYSALATGQPFWVFTLWAQFDALVAGAALYLLQRAGWQLKWAAMVTPLLLMAMVALETSGEHTPLRAVLTAACVIALSMYAVWHSRSTSGSLIGRLLNSTQMQYLGRISYGIYLYHMVASPLCQLLARHVPGIWKVIAPGSVLGFVVYVAVTLGMATLSYRYFEQPIRRRARNFEGPDT